jgi:hypothetical protein
MVVGFVLEARPTSGWTTWLQALGLISLGALLGLKFRGLLRAAPWVFRLRAVRLMLAGVGMTLAAIEGWIVALFVSGQRFGVVQDILIVLTFAGMGIILVAMLIGLFDASTHAIERYSAEHPQRH